MCALLDVQRRAKARTAGFPRARQELRGADRGLPRGPRPRREAAQAVGGRRAHRRRGRRQREFFSQKMTIFGY